jgi:hypothetical protein
MAETANNQGLSLDRCWLAAQDPARLVAPATKQFPNLTNRNTGPIMDNFTAAKGSPASAQEVNSAPQLVLTTETETS